MIYPAALGSVVGKHGVYNTEASSYWLVMPSCRLSAIVPTRTRDSTIIQRLTCSTREWLLNVSPRRESQRESHEIEREKDKFRNAFDHSSSLGLGFGARAPISLWPTTNLCSYHHYPNTSLPTLFFPPCPFCYTCTWRSILFFNSSNVFILISIGFNVFYFKFSTQKSLERIVKLHGKNTLDEYIHIPNTVYTCPKLKSRSSQ